MTRISLILTAVLTSAASPAVPIHLASSAPNLVADVSPDAPQSASVARENASPLVARRDAPTPSGFTKAPVPDADIAAPTPSGRRQSASLTPSLFNTRDAYRGDGFLPKSTTQTEQEKRLKPTPGINLSVPLD